MKKSLCIVLAAVLLMVCAGCAAQPAATEKPVEEMSQEELMQMLYEQMGMTMEAEQTGAPLNVSVKVSNDPDWIAFITEVVNYRPASYTYTPSSTTATATYNGVPVTYTVSFDGQIFTVVITSLDNNTPFTKEMHYGSITGGQNQAGTMVILYLINPLDEQSDENMCIGFYWPAAL